MDKTTAREARGKMRSSRERISDARKSLSAGDGTAAMKSLDAAIAEANAAKEVLGKPAASPTAKK